MTDTDRLKIPVMPRRKRTILNILIYTTFGCALTLVFYFFYLLWWPFNPLTIRSVSVITPTVQVGDSLIYKISSCKNTQDTPTVYRKIVSSTSAVSLMTSNGVLGAGCSVKEVPIPIPKGTLAGKYILYTEVIYRINAVRDIHVFWHTNPFEVTQ